MLRWTPRRAPCAGCSPAPRLTRPLPLATHGLPAWRLPVRHAGPASAPHLSCLPAAPPPWPRSGPDCGPAQLLHREPLVPNKVLHPAQQRGGEGGRGWGRGRVRVEAVGGGRCDAVGVSSLRWRPRGPVPAAPGRDCCWAASVVTATAMPAQLAASSAPFAAFPPGAQAAAAPRAVAGGGRRPLPAHRPGHEGVDWWQSLCLVSHVAAGVPQPASPVPAGALQFAPPFSTNQPISKQDEFHHRCCPVHPHQPPSPFPLRSPSYLLFPNLHAQDEFYNRYLVKNHLMAPVVAAFLGEPLATTGGVSTARRRWLAHACSHLSRRRAGGAAAPRRRGRLAACRSSVAQRHSSPLPSPRRQRAALQPAQLRLPGAV